MEIKKENIERYLNTIARPVNSVQIHHSENPKKETWEQIGSEKIFNWIKKYHVDILGWKDIAYHFIIMPDGGIWNGRDVNKAPAGIIGHNKNALALCLIGNFDYEKITTEQFMSFNLVAKKIQEKTKVSKSNFYFHRDFSHKTCPGKNIQKDWLLEYLI